jgi:hypothetical protein
MQIITAVKGVQMVAEYPVEKLGYSIYVIEVEGWANPKRSKELLAELGLEPVPPQKFFLAMFNNPKLLNAAKGKWAYLAGKGFDKEGLFAINDKTGEIETPKGESVEKLVYTWPGNGPLMVKVQSDVGAAYYGRRFALYAGISPNYTATVVFGIKLYGSMQQTRKTLPAELIDALRSMYYTIKRRA